MGLEVARRRSFWAPGSSTSRGTTPVVPCADMPSPPQKETTLHESRDALVRAVLAPCSLDLRADRPDRRDNLSTDLRLPDRPPRATRPVLLFHPPPSPTTNLAFFRRLPVLRPADRPLCHCRHCSARGAMDIGRTPFLEGHGFEPAILPLPFLFSAFRLFGLPDRPFPSAFSPRPIRSDPASRPHYLYGPIRACHRRGAAV